MMTSARQMAMRRSRVQTWISCRSRLCEEPKLSGDAVSEVVEEKGEAWALGESPGGGETLFSSGFSISCCLCFLQEKLHPPRPPVAESSHGTILSFGFRRSRPCCMEKATRTGGAAGVLADGRGKGFGHEESGQ